MATLKTNGWVRAVSWVALLLLGAAPLAGLAEPPGHGDAHGGHGWHGAAARAPAHRGEGLRRPEGPRVERRFAAPRYAVPHHWVGMHPHWGQPRSGHWVRPWGPRWVPHYWAGGDWGGRFWPHVSLGWDFPWFLAALPIGYSTYWWGNVPYYYWQGVYYVWSPDYGQYVVTDPPPVTGGVAQGAAPPPAAQPGAAPGQPAQGALSLYVYPKKGQSQQQTADDRYQCHQWAVGQTGFDPTDSTKDTGASTATPGNYERAVTACLEARGYSVR